MRTQNAAGETKDSPIRGSDIIVEIKRAGIKTVVALPDIVTSDNLLWPISRDPSLRLVRICKEDEGISICAGLAFTRQRAILLIQHTGLLDSFNAVRLVAVEYQAPICMLVGLQGMEPDRQPPESTKYGVRIVEPLLDVMGIEHVRLGQQGDEARVFPALERAYEESRPVVFLLTRSPE